MSGYDAAFYDAINAGAARSAAIVCSWVAELLAPKSVVDVGCGEGVWLAAWGALGVSDVLGLDGSYVDLARLRIPATNFRPTDLGAPFDIGRKFDLVQSLEVAEHLSAESSMGFVRSLCAHGDAVLFSAAPPGQFGVDHVNEQPYQYWRERFDAGGFDCFDALRPRFAGDRRIERWYRYNAFLFLKRGSQPANVDRMQPFRVQATETLRDVAPLGWRARKAFFRAVPRPLTNALARLSARARAHR